MAPPVALGPLTVRAGAWWMARDAANGVTLGVALGMADSMVDDDASGMVDSAADCVALYMADDVGVGLGSSPRDLSFRL